MTFNNGYFTHKFNFAAFSLCYKFIATGYKNAYRGAVRTPDDPIFLLEINNAVQVGFSGQSKGVPAYATGVITGIRISWYSPLRPSFKFEQVIFGCYFHCDKIMIE